MRGRVGVRERGHGEGERPSCDAVQKRRVKDGEGVQVHVQVFVFLYVNLFY